MFSTHNLTPQIRRMLFISFILLSISCLPRPYSYGLFPTNLLSRCSSTDTQCEYSNIEDKTQLTIQEVAKNAFDSTNREWENIQSYEPNTSKEVDKITSLLLVRLFNMVSSDSVQSTSNLCQEILDQKISAWPSAMTNEMILSLRKYVTQILELHQNVYYHNHNHAFHVVNNANKLLDMIVLHSHDGSIQIKSDSTFIFLFSSLIHDVGHTGLTNAQISIEKHPYNDLYDSHNQLERHSLDLAFNVLERAEFKPVRQHLFGIEGTKSYSLKSQTFQEAVTTIILRTDISDVARKKERLDMVNQLYLNKTIHSSAVSPILLLEQLMLIADVGGAIQGWTNYLESSNNLYFEWKFAYESGRLAFDPESNWVEAQSGFLQNYCLEQLPQLNLYGYPTIATMLEKSTKKILKTWETKGEMEAKKVKSMWQEEKLKKKNF